MTDTKEQLVIALRKIAENWELSVVESIKQEVMGTGYLYKNALLLSMFKNRYQKAQKEFKFVII